MHIYCSIWVFFFIVKAILQNIFKPHTKKQNYLLRNPGNISELMNFNSKQFEIYMNKKLNINHEPGI